MRPSGSRVARSRHQLAILSGRAGPAGDAGRPVHHGSRDGSELGDLSRFAHPRQLMAWLGVTPSEHSSGDKRRQGSITKTGNSYARKLLVEAAWSYRHPARVSPEIQRRHKASPSPSLTAPGTRRCACAGATGSSLRAASRRILRWSRSLANSPVSLVRPTVRRRDLRLHLNRRDHHADHDHARARSRARAPAARRRDPPPSPIDGALGGSADHHHRTWHRPGDRRHRAATTQPGAQRRPPTHTRKTIRRHPRHLNTPGAFGPCTANQTSAPRPAR